MATEPQSAAGGAFIALAILVGAIAGALSGQPTVGVLAGAATGIACAVWIWLRDRRRIGH
ncbi:hypothetical protein [Sphingomonas crusticola]|uniref:hypothetical protein n=1 Tax=Sphingomonas crusticola TaxID=1697973 RepID=UPI000E23B46C|nr:hypothetical protein [Sphingomonas crusticola]